jgi:hypothetical protein
MPGYASQGCFSPENTVCFLCTHRRYVHPMFSSSTAVNEPLFSHVKSLNKELEKLTFSGEKSDDDAHSISTMVQATRTACLNVQTPR